jgi:hypothetical protein
VVGMRSCYIDANHCLLSIALMETMAKPTRKRTWRRRSVHWFGWLAALYLGLAYLAVPEFWLFRTRDDVFGPADMLTHTPDGIAGDPVNVGLVGVKSDILRAFAVAGWDAADAITLKSSLEIGESVVFDRPYPDAPVSTLLFEGRKQDLAFEKPVGESADQRHHVRFWKTEQTGPSGAPLWLGSVSFDKGVGLSHDTGQITHHIGPDVDAERDALIADLEKAGWVQSTYVISGRGETLDGRNGGDDLYYTDGQAWIAVLNSPAGP